MRKVGKQLSTAIMVLGLAVSGLVTTPRPVQAGSRIEVTTFEDGYSLPGVCTLRDAIEAANRDGYFGGCYAGHGADTILLKAGTYQLTILHTGDGHPESGDLNITSDLTITGMGSQEAGGTIIDASALGDRAIQVRHPSSSISVKISGLSIRGGTITGNGGAISNDSNRQNVNSRANLQLENVALTGNQAGWPSAVGLGGGVFNGFNCTLTISGSAISNNQGSFGGGIFNYGALTVNNSIITGNQAFESGGGIDSRPFNGEQVYFTGSTVSGNSVIDKPKAVGGAASNGRLTVQNSSIAENTGIGLSINSDSTVSVTGTTISKNTSTGADVQSGTAITIRDSVFSQNVTGLKLASNVTSSLTSVYIHSNTSADENSAAGLDGAGNITLNSSSISDNSGGGVVLKEGTASMAFVQVNGNAGTGVQIDYGAGAVITNTSVFANTPADPGAGGGIVVSGNLELRNSTVAGNRGIGLKVNQWVDSNQNVLRGAASITNSTIGEQTAEDPAQGIGIVNAGELHLLHITLAHNSDAGLRLENDSSVEVQNSILTGNGNSNCAIIGTSVFSSLGNNLVYPLDSGSDACPFLIGSGDLGENPLLDNQLLNHGGPTRTYAITDLASPAVDAIPSYDAGCPAVDQRLLARPVVSKGDPVNGVRGPGA